MAAWIYVGHARHDSPVFWHDGSLFLKFFVTKAQKTPVLIQTAINHSNPSAQLVIHWTSTP